jgi:hypothetical protein
LFSLNLLKTYKLKDIKSNAIRFSPDHVLSFGQDDMTVFFYGNYGLVRTDSDGLFSINSDNSYSELSGGYNFSNILDLELWLLNF